jgi:hypothetical protein
MDILKKYNEIKSNLYKNTDLIYNQEMSTLSDLLKIKDISLINIHNKNEIISDYEFKLEVLSIIETLVDNGLIIKDKALLNTIGDLVIKVVPEINVDFCLQLEDLLKNVWSKCIRILYYCGNIKDLPQISAYISRQDIPDIRNICLALTFELSEFRSYDLENLSHFSSLSVLYDVVKIYKDEIPPEIKGKILINLYNLLSEDKFENTENNRFLEKIMKSPNYLFKVSNAKMTPRDLKFARLIFYEINFLPFYGLIRVPYNGTFSNDYMMHMYSLIVDEKSAFGVFEILRVHEVIIDMHDGINKLLINKIDQNQPVDPRDEDYLFFLMEVVVKILKFSRNNQIVKITFMMFCDMLMKYVVEDASKEAEGVIYEFLSFYCEDKETYSNIVEFFKSKTFFTKDNLLQVFDEDMKSKKYLVMGRLLKFLYNIDPQLSIEMSVYALRSEDVETVKSCFEVFNNVDYDISSHLMLNSNHIRRTILKSKDLINILINYQISKEVSLEDVLLINVIMSINNSKFFEYTRLFKDFGKYMNDKFLERLINNVEDGLDFLETRMTPNTVKFIKNNEKWFNLFLMNNKMYYPVIFRIYEKMLSIDKNIEMSYEDGFVLLEVPESSIFNILSKKIMFNTKKNYSKYITNKEYKMDEDVLESYIVYLKSRLFVGDNIESLIKYLITDYENIDDLLGYYKIVTGINLDTKNESVVCNYDRVETSSFINNYYKVSDFEKVFLFLQVEDKISKEDEIQVLRIVKDEVTRISLLQNKKREDLIIYRQCMLLLLRLSNIDSIVRLIDDFEDSDLLLKINIRNLMTGGLFFNTKCVMKGKKNLQISAIYLLYFNNVWDINLLRNWINGLYKECRDSEDMKYLVSDINKKHDIEIY